MRKVIVGAFVSLDGVMQSPGGREEDPTDGFDKGGWVAPHIDEAFGKEVDTLFGGPFDLLLGRKTYEIFAAHWPFMEGGEYDAIAKAFKDATKYVASRKGVELTWDKSVQLADAAADVAKLKREGGPQLVTQGSTHLIQSLLKADLVDEIRLLTFPVLIGKGKKLFGEGLPALGFKLTHSKTTPAGVVIARYQRAGEVQTQDITMDKPNALELARRERMKREG